MSLFISMDCSRIASDSPLDSAQDECVRLYGVSRSHLRCAPMGNPHAHASTTGRPSYSLYKSQVPCASVRPVMPSLRLSLATVVRVPLDLLRRPPIGFLT